MQHRWPRASRGATVQVLLIVLVILATVVVSEGISSRVRKAVI